MRFFTTEGPVNCADHYCLPPLARFDLDDILALIAQKKYLLLRAPRHTGDYVDRCGAEEAHLLIFDRSKEKPWAEKIWRREKRYRGKPITVWGA